MNQATRSDALKRLDVFAGDWIMQATFPGAPLTGPGGRAVFEWVLSGQYLFERSVVPGAPDSIALVSIDPDKQSYTQHYSDSRGVVRVYAMAFSEGA